MFRNSFFAATMLLLVSFVCRATDTGGFHYRDVTTTKAGELATLLGDDLLNIDSLVVRGPINDADFKTLKHGVFSGKMSVVNLQYSDIENRLIPAKAFYKCTGLRRIIFPDNLEVIGGDAFSCDENLRTINIPPGLKTIWSNAFAHCTSLSLDRLVFPEGLEEIGMWAFEETPSLKCEVVFPSTLTKISRYSFMLSGITSIVFPEEMAYIGENAFAWSGLKKLTFPKNFRAVFEGSAFLGCESLTEVTLDVAMTDIPYNMFTSCTKLKKVELTDLIEIIHSGAFNNTDLKEIVPPRYTYYIERFAYANIPDCKFLYFQNFVRFIGYRCFYGTKLPEKIYCQALSPPGCELIDAYDTTGKSVRMSPFQYDENTTVNTTTTVYVPVGSGDLYRRTPGWDYFANIVELDTSDFPAAGIDDITVDGIDVGDGVVYDLSGRRVANPVEGQVYIMNGKKFIYRM